MACTTIQSNLEVVVDLPRPPSLNRLWRFGRGRMYRSKAYMDWLRQADLHWLCAKPKMRVKGILGTFQAEIILSRPDKRRRDVDNGVKAVLDWAQRVEIIENDSLCEQAIIRYGKPEEAPLGVRLIIKGVDKHI